jgi:hypothetical protein
MKNDAAAAAYEQRRCAPQALIGCAAAVIGVRSAHHCEA